MPTDFTARVLSVVRRIPRGRVATYGDVAAMAGRPRAARAVGSIMRTCRRPDIPCHRVVEASGRLGGYGGSQSLKRALLLAEGVPLSGGRLTLDACRVVGWSSGRERPRNPRIDTNGIIKGKTTPTRLSQPRGRVVRRKR